MQRALMVAQGPAVRSAGAPVAAFELPPIAAACCTLQIASGAPRTPAALPRQGSRPSTAPASQTATKGRGRELGQQPQAPKHTAGRDGGRHQVAHRLCAEQRSVREGGSSRGAYRRSGRPPAAMPTPPCRCHRPCRLVNKCNKPDSVSCDRRSSVAVAGAVCRPLPPSQRGSAAARGPQRRPGTADGSWRVLGGRWSTAASERAAGARQHCGQGLVFVAAAAPATRAIARMRGSSGSSPRSSRVTAAATAYQQRERPA